MAVELYASKVLLADNDTNHGHGISDSITAVKDAISTAQVWALVLYIILAGSIYATMARGFGWI